MSDIIDGLKRLNLKEILEICWHTDFRKAGQRYVALSPFREEKQRSFYVNQEQDGHWVYYDHGIGSGGSILDAIMERDGHADIHRAIETAREMAEQSGMHVANTGCTQNVPKETAYSQDKLNYLLKQMEKNEVTECREYIVNRGIAESIIDSLIGSSNLVHNRYNETSYICFAVRDSKGILQSLYNRKIAGRSEVEKFLLGRQYPFCLDWNQLKNAARVFLCESIIDALSILSIDSTYCVIGLPGVTGNKLDPDQFLPEAELIECFDQDEAGRKAALALKEQFPDHQILQADLEDAHDVNNLVCQQKSENKPLQIKIMNKSPTAHPHRKLSIDDQIAIVLSGDSSRKLAEQYGIHHSRICKIRNEAQQILKESWQGRKPGPKAKETEPDEVKQMGRELTELKHKHGLLEMRRDWLELRLELEEKRVEEAARKARNRKKKLRKKNKK